MERRRTPRLVATVPGRWRGQRGGGSCLLGYISLGGCFVYSADSPDVGEPVTVTLEVDRDIPVAILQAVVIYVVVDPMARSEMETGFGVRFQQMESTGEADLVGLLATVRHRRQTA